MGAFAHPGLKSVVMMSVVPEAGTRTINTTDMIHIKVGDKYKKMIVESYARNDISNPFDSTNY